MALFRRSPAKTESGATPEAVPRGADARAGAGGQTQYSYLEEPYVSLKNRGAGAADLPAVGAPGER